MEHPFKVKTRLWWKIAETAAVRKLTFVKRAVYDLCLLSTAHVPPYK